MWQIGQREEHAPTLVFEHLQLGVELLDPLTALAVCVEDAAGVLSKSLQSRDFLARRVLLSLERLHFQDERAAASVEHTQLGEQAARVEAAVLQGCSDALWVVTDDGRVDHVESYTSDSSAGDETQGVRNVKTAIRKAVFPAAGLGTRFLPATKAQPKEMLPLVDKPIIQYGVEEALASGVSNIILVTGRGKNAIEDHFDVSVELETFLEARGKKEQLEEVRKISNLINFAYVRQGEPLGLGHAVLVTEELVGNEPFAVILGDDVIDAEPPALRADDRRVRRSRRPRARGGARAAG